MTAFTIGYEPTKGCGPHCECWRDAYSAGWGYCKKDNPETTGPMRIGELARWREEELDNEDL